jgi:hypothetical protein
MDAVMKLAEKSVKVDVFQQIEEEQERDKEDVKKKIDDDKSDSSSSSSSSESKFSSSNVSHKNNNKKNNNNDIGADVVVVQDKDGKLQQIHEENQRINQARAREKILKKSSMDFLELAIIFSAIGIDLWRYFVSHYHFAHRKSRKSIEDGAKIKIVANAVDESLL